MSIKLDKQIILEELKLISSIDSLEELRIKYLGKKVIGEGDFSQLGGPIKIAQITGQVAEHGIMPFITIMAYISISLGLINLFPIPMLDGGHLMFYLFETILGKPLSQKTQEGFFRIGLFLLLFLMVFVTFNDLKGILPLYTDLFLISKFIKSEQNQYFFRY